MRNTVLPLTLALLALPAVASAGHDEECTAELQTCIDSMVAELKSTGFIGVELDEKKGTKDLVVTKVVTGAPAEAAGIKDGDVLLALNGIPFDKKNWKKMAEVKKPGAEVTCTIKRGGASKNIKLTLAPMPADLMAKYIGEYVMRRMKHRDEQTASND